MRITVLYVAGCPHRPQMETNLRHALRAAGLDGLQPRAQVVESLQDAERLEFPGSPTVLIDGEDPFARPGATPSLSCRLYRTPDGVATAPTVEQLEQALRAASR